MTTPGLAVGALVRVVRGSMLHGLRGRLVGIDTAAGTAWVDPTGSPGAIGFELSDLELDDEEARASDQPPEVGPEPEPGDLPPLEAAARRVLAYVAAFGDGEVANLGPDVVLYARDLVAVAQAAARLTDPDDVTLEACAFALYAHDNPEQTIRRVDGSISYATPDPSVTWRDEGPAARTGRARYRSRAAAVLDAAAGGRRAL